MLKALNLKILQLSREQAHDAHRVFIPVDARLLPVGNARFILVINHLKSGPRLEQCVGLVLLVRGPEFRIDALDRAIRSFDQDKTAGFEGGDDPRDVARSITGASVYMKVIRSQRSMP